MIIIIIIIIILIITATGKTQPGFSFVFLFFFSNIHQKFISMYNSLNKNIAHGLQMCTEHRRTTINNVSHLVVCTGVNNEPRLERRTAQQETSGLGPRGADGVVSSQRRQKLNTYKYVHFGGFCIVP